MFIGVWRGEVLAITDLGVLELELKFYIDITFF